MSLTAKDQDTLQRALELRRHDNVGIFPKCAKQLTQFEKLEKWGLLVFRTIGRDIDGEVERYVRIYTLTLKGHSLAEILETLV